MAGRFFENFGVFADVNGGPSTLRRVVMKLAVSGRLGTTDPSARSAVEDGLAVSSATFTSPHVDDADDLLLSVPLPAPNWMRTKLGTVVELAYGKSLPSKIRNGAGRVPTYGSNGVVGFHDQALVLEPCLVVGRKGSSGAIALAESPCWPIDTAYYVVAPRGISLHFLFLLLGSLKLDRLDRSTAIPGLNRADAYALTVLIPAASRSVLKLGGGRA